MIINLHPPYYCCVFYFALMNQGFGEKKICFVVTFLVIPVYSHLYYLYFHYLE